LKRNASGERNAFAVVDDDPRAAANRKAVLGERLSQEDVREYERQVGANYTKNGKTGFHQMVIRVAGPNGPEIAVRC